MKLTEIEVRGYRSLFQGDGGHFKVALGGGVNSLVGPNNVGKSNVFRALALALDPEFEFDRGRDMPAGWTWSKPTVTLTFRIQKRGMSSRERTLLKRLREYEEAVHPGRSGYFADERVVKLRATIEGGQDSAGVRRRAFVTKGAGARDLGDDDPIAVKAIGQFDECVRFVMVRSGESLESLLQGRFRDVLQAILKAELSEQYEEAGTNRGRYVKALQDGLLASLRDRITEELTELFPEVRSVELQPSVRNLEDTLTGMQVRVSDTAVTDLGDKGTGVRGGLIVGMLQHLAATTKRSMVFAVEEPESFLHPAAQEVLREDLEDLAEGRDISLLVTTHSPYVISRRPDAQLVSLAKTPDGCTHVQGINSGIDPLGSSLAGLFRSSLVTGFMDLATRSVEGERAILVVEGYTDAVWMRLAAERAGRSDLLEGLTICAAGQDGTSDGGGADVAVTEALVLSATSDLPVGVLFDNDESGKQAMKVMARINQKTAAWKVRKRVHSYGHVFDPSSASFPYEAEDLWPDELHEAFLATTGHDGYLAEKTVRPRPVGGYHFGYTHAAKGELLEFLDEHVRSEHCDRWIEMLTHVRSGLGIAQA